MNIKTKLNLGIGLLFFLITLLSLAGVKYMNELKNDTQNILVANYNSLEYCRNMLVALEDKSEHSLPKFVSNLQKQEKNITEIGEQETTADIRVLLDTLAHNISDSSIQSAIRKNVFTLMDMNMQAIHRKSAVAKATADKAVLLIGITGTFCFLIALILFINLPSSIANPITVLTDSIKQIAAQNYSKRVHFQSNSEFGELAKSFNVMAQKLEEYNNSNLAKLMMEKKRIETLINNMHDPVIGLDENLNVVFANKEAVNISGLSNAEFVGKSALEIAVHNDLVRTLIHDIVDGEQKNGQKKTPIKIYSANKESYFEKETLRILITPTGDVNSKLVGHVVLLRNVTNYKELDFAKTNFIATVSHEFKTPISSMKMSLELLENNQVGKLNDEQKNLVESIKDDANRLLKITGELLNMTQVESGNIQLAISYIDPKDILLYAINAVKTQAEQKQIEFEINCPEDVPFVKADIEKTTWVLVNLMSNAIRYSYENSTVYLTVSTIGNHVSFSVKDMGQGIAPEYIEKIFERYFRVPGTKKDGTGLGLAISKEFIEAQGGQITVSSEYGAGSDFTFTLNKSDSNGIDEVS